MGEKVHGLCPIMSSLDEAGSVMEIGCYGAKCALWDRSVGGCTKGLSLDMVRHMLEAVRRYYR